MYGYVADTNQLDWSCKGDSQSWHANVRIGLNYPGCDWIQSLQCPVHCFREKNNAELARDSEWKEVRIHSLFILRKLQFLFWSEIYGWKPLLFDLLLDIFTNGVLFVKHFPGSLIWLAKIFMCTQHNNGFELKSLNCVVQFVDDLASHDPIVSLQRPSTTVQQMGSTGRKNKIVPTQ